ncbi:hypothetical protein [Streptomyces sp. 769]|uniref:hypothetical protein n=1 Tax=Streptomyces sp. 769 TaxID=1262452 RepID=UPI000581C267|nr:hypothetical protein [Streptomyces sp. 769]AJC55081.1 hypothetical protein GZL_02490 [Streptomyces sp. 769]
MPPIPPFPPDFHHPHLQKLAFFIRESEHILAAWDAYSDEHTDLDGWPHDDVTYGLRAAHRDAKTWRSFHRVRPFAKELLATAEVQLQQLNSRHIQPQWVWQLSTLSTALSKLAELERAWLDTLASLPPSARPGTPEWDDAVAERNAEAWSYLDDWASHSKALLEIQAATLDFPPRSPTLTAAKAPRPAPPATTPSARR